MESDYRGAIKEVKSKALKDSKGTKVQSVRLIINGYLQRRALKPTEKTWDTYMTYAFPGEALQYISGFVVRVVI